jgi:methanethiol S-methyltransferase
MRIKMKNKTTHKTKFDILIIAFTAAIGIASLGLFCIFLYSGLPGLIDLGLNDWSSLIVDLLLSLLFFCQHSLMLRNHFQKWLSKFIQPLYHGAIYSIFSGLCLSIVMLFWQKTTWMHMELNGVLYGVMRGLFFISIFGFYATSRALKSADLLGIKRLFRRLKGKIDYPARFVIQGSYQWVRHPLYFLTLLLIWTPISITTDRLLFNGLWTVWIVVGTILEEKDLISLFGDDYRTYQKKVPMLIPCKRSPYRGINNKSTSKGA